MTQQWKTTVAAEGEAAVLTLPRPALGAWKAGTELGVVPLLPEAALLLRAGRKGGFVAASLDAFGVDELFGYVVAQVRSGRLLVQTPTARKTVTFRDGQVVFATSTEPWQRLGAALVSLGLLTPGQLTSALDEVRPGLKLGQVLTRKQLITPARLYAGMTFLVREIVVDLFCAQEGTALFVEGRPAEEQLKLPDATRDLALEGLRRSEEVRRLRHRLTPELRLGQAGDPPEGPGLPLWEKAGAGAELQALRASFEGGDHAFLSLVDELLQAGRLAVRPKTAEPRAVGARAEVAPVLERYGAVIRAICEALQQAGHGLEDLRAFLAEPQQGLEKAFEGVTLSDEGALELPRLLANVGAHPVHRRARAYQALEAFVSYAVFSARNVLPQQTAAELEAAVRALHEEELP